MNFQTIGAHEFWNLMRQGDVYLIDLRDGASYRKFHPANARNLPYEEMDRWKGNLPKNKKLILYCEHGSTSMMAARRLSRMGYQVYALVGGVRTLEK